MISWAENHVDVLVVRAFPQPGSYLDLGAAAGDEGSFSRALFDCGWRGAHVAGSAEAVTFLRDHRPGDVVLAAADVGDVGRFLLTVDVVRLGPAVDVPPGLLAELRPACVVDRIEQVAPTGDGVREGHGTLAGHLALAGDRVAAADGVPAGDRVAAADGVLAGHVALAGYVLAYRDARHRVWCRGDRPDLVDALALPPDNTEYEAAPTVAARLRAEAAEAQLTVARATLATATARRIALERRLAAAIAVPPAIEGAGATVEGAAGSDPR